MNHIDTDNYEAAGIEVIQFPGGEWHATVPQYRPQAHVHVFAKLRTWEDVGKLLAVADAVQTQGLRVYLFAPYFPGMRMDRNPEGTNELGVRVYGNLLQLVGRNVTTVDPHSEVGVTILRDIFYSVKIIDPTLFIADLIEDTPSIVLSPDKGAASRAAATAIRLGCGVVQADKKRDFATGALTGFSVPRLGDVERILIPDDICDGGGTFVGLLEEIRKQTEAPVDLYVSHGIFSKGFESLRGFDHIYTTDSFYEPDQWFPKRPDEQYPGWIKSINLLPYYFGGLRP